MERIIKFIQRFVKNKKTSTNTKKATDKKKMKIKMQKIKKIVPVPKKQQITKR